MSRERLFSILFVLLFGFLSRFLPHPPNFTAMGAMALFCGATMPRLSQSVMVLFSMVLLSDAIFGFYPDMLFVYASYGLIAFFGGIAQPESALKRTVVCSIVCSLLFFLITNFGVWVSYSFYPKSLYGLAMCYVAAIPFAFNQFLGDLFLSPFLYFALRYSHSSGVQHNFMAKS